MANPFLEIQPLYGRITVHSARRCEALIDRLAAAPRFTTLVWFEADAEGEAGRRLWLSNAFRRFSAMEYDLAEVLFGGGSSAYQQLHEALDRWFEVRQLNERQWIALPEAHSAGYTMSRVYVSERRMISVYKWYHHHIRISVVGRSDDGTPCEVHLRLTVEEATQLATGGRRNGGSFQIRDSYGVEMIGTFLSSTTSLVLQSPKGARPRQTFQLSAIQWYAMKNRILDVVQAITS